MKKLVLFVFLFASFQAFGQFPNYTNINGRYKWIAGKFDSTFTIPSGTTPSLRTGGGTGPGALFYRTTDSTVYQYTGTQWIKLRAGVSPTDTAGIWISNVYRKTGTDSVYYVKGGTSTFAFRDSIGNVGGGGGGGKIYYFNGGVNLGTFAGLTMYELGDTAVTSAAANFTRSTTGNLANFITDVNRPGLLQIPAGVWTVDAYLRETGGGSNHAQIWIEVEKWDGSTITTIATSPIEEITNGNVIDLYTWAVSIPTTTLAVTDRIIIQFYITNTNGKTVTLYTQNGYVGEIHTTFTTGIGSLNGLTAPTQYFATGTSGTDFAISSSTATHTFNLPTASGTNRGALSSADWTTFNGKVGGSGTTNYVPKFTASGTIGNSFIFDNGTNVGIGTNSPAAQLDVTAGNGEIRSTGTAASYTQYNAFITSGVNMRIGAYATNNGYLGTTTNHPFTISTNNTERARFTASGRLLIGTTTESTYELDLVGDIRSTLDANINGLTVGKGLNSVSGNSVFGVNAGRQITTGENNTFIGSETGDKNTTANHNTSVGHRAGFNNTGGQNTFLGSGAGFDNTTGINNINVGYNAGRVTTGQFNVLIGSSTGIGLTTGNYNTIIGSQVTGLSASLSNTIILADGQGNQRLYINSSGNVGIGTASPSTKITMFGQNPIFRVQGDGVSYYGGISFYSSVSGSNRENGAVGQYDGNGLYIGSGTGMRLTFTTNGGTEAMRLTSAGRLLIGTTTESTYIVDANGTVRVQGTELRLDNATTGTINLYSNTPKVNFFSGGGYSIGRNSTAVELISGGSIAFYIGANQGYSLTSANGHVWYSAIAGSAVLARLDTGGSLSIGNGSTAANASSILDLTSTTKGFLPPRMTGAQAEAIGTPAAGLMVYSTDGSGATITSLGWWGYNGTTWVKLN